MASFLENFAEAMGLTKANHTQHLSNISESDRQRYRNQYTGSIRKAGQEENRGFSLYDAKDSGDYLTTTGGTFNEDWNDDNLYETRVYDFNYAKPGSRDNMDSTRPAYGHGKMLVRVPKKKSSDGTLGRYFNDESGFHGDIGVYEAVLDNGQVLNAKELEDMIYSNPYTQDMRGIVQSQYASFTPKGQSILGDNSAKLNAFNEYKREVRSNAEPRSVAWNSNYRRWMAK